MSKTGGEIDRLKMLCEFSELNWLFSNSEDIRSFLDKIVQMVSKHMHAGAATVFLWNDNKEELILEATIGLNKGAIGQVRLKPGEGLTGLALLNKQPILVENADAHPQFKRIPSIHEEKFKNFLAVPILRGIMNIGVISIQREQERPFKTEDLQALTVIASQLANILENTRTHLMSDTDGRAYPLKSLQMKEGERIDGKTACTGLQSGEIFILDRERSLSMLSEEVISDEDTLEDFKKAVEKTERQLRELQTKTEELLDDTASLIFTSHLLILKDQDFIGEIHRHIQKGSKPSTAIFKVADRYMELFASNPSPFVKEKVHDVEDVILRLVGNLVKETDASINMKGRILIARELYPSDILQASSEGAAGIVLVSGGITSHISILSQSLRLPMVIVDRPELMNLAPHQRVIMDGHDDCIYVNPPKELEQRLFRERKGEDAKTGKTAVLKTTKTKDGTKITLMANVNLISDIDHAEKAHAEGVGLYRTEFPFLIRSNFPSEEEQYTLYRKICTAMRGKPVVFRTLDIGGDKILSYYQDYQERNPFLGLRSIRFSLMHRDTFREQIRAILRASGGGTLRIMFPMISSVEEFIEAKNVVIDCKKELKKEGYPLPRIVKIGMMVEVPSITEIMEDLCDYADFFSIGTNDFIQYILAVDRSNEKVAEFYLSHHPSVLRSLKRIVETAQKRNKEIAVCGEMARQELFIPFLLGIGVRVFSMGATYIPATRKLISRITLREARETATRAVQFKTCSETEVLLTETLNKIKSRN
ncbi:MAG: phosphoenolpyruvate--protein phosphotransferase [Spirochaetales bacterium]|nr:phosphoenolpyruvate--protein phosphotransferase [Spirochaetales bacterium]